MTIPIQCHVAGDGQHQWRFDGDDPYVICYLCNCIQDGLTGRVIQEGWTP